MTPDELLGRLLYRDGLLLVIDKPAGLPVHSGPRGGENLEQHLDALRFGLPKPPALAHRLDRDTSGCLALGRQRKGLARLGKLFAEGRAEKTYWAVVEGAPPTPEGRIDRPLRKLERKTGWRMVADPAGQPSVTEWRTLGSGRGVTWLELRPRTGRTHQIRVHCAELGCPVLGDSTYGRGGAPLHLHARRLALPLYPARLPIVAEAPVPPHMRAALEACGWREDEAIMAAKEDA
jgi:tRNA pseudouridine32 synthase/23S rRNA pseudouridine746 synthase/23S rRNA pseudouridine1911/1915/1917 synthase